MGYRIDLIIKNKKNDNIVFDEQIASYLPIEFLDELKIDYDSDFCFPTTKVDFDLLFKVLLNNALSEIKNYKELHKFSKQKISFDLEEIIFNILNQDTQKIPGYQLLLADSKKDIPGINVINLASKILQCSNYYVDFEEKHDCFIEGS